jgi:hypothetical protein
MARSFRRSLLGLDPLQEHAFTRADAGTHPEYRELFACDRIVDAVPVSLMAEEELRDLVSATQDVTRDVGCGTRLECGVTRAGGRRKRRCGSRIVGHDYGLLELSERVRCYA